MTYTSPVVAVVDGLGYLWCNTCALAFNHVGRVVYADNSALDGDTCDGCGSSLFDRKTKVA